MRIGVTEIHKSASPSEKELTTAFEMYGEGALALRPGRYHSPSLGHFKILEVEMEIPSPGQRYTVGSRTPVTQIRTTPDIYLKCEKRGDLDPEIMNGLLDTKSFHRESKLEVRVRKWKDRDPDDYIGRV